MELKIFRDTLPQGGAGCTVKAELPLETEIRISDDLPPVGKLVKCFVRPVVLQRQLQPGRLTLEGYLRGRADRVPQHPRGRPAPY